MTGRWNWGHAWYLLRHIRWGPAPQSTGVLIQDQSFPALVLCGLYEFGLRNAPFAFRLAWRLHVIHQKFRKWTRP
jgi:hypothetical protein